MCAAIRSATGSAPRNFSAPTSSPRDALVGQRRPRARERGARRRAARARGARGSPQRGHPPRSHGSARAHAAHSRSSARAQRAPARRARRAARRSAIEFAPAASMRGHRCAGTLSTDQHAIVTILRRVRAKSAREPRCRSMRAGRSRPIVLLALAAYVVDLRLALAHLARRGRRARGAGRPARAVAAPASFCLFLALISPIDRLGEQFASVHMVQHLLIADLAPICLTLALTKHILRPATRRIHWIERAAGPFGHPGVRRRRLRRRDVALARPGHVRGRARALVRPRARAPDASPPPGSCTGGTCSRRSARGCGSAASARCSTWRSTKILVGFLGILLAFSPDVLYDFYEQPAARAGA